MPDGSVCLLPLDKRPPTQLSVPLIPHDAALQLLYAVACGECASKYGPCQLPLLREYPAEGLSHNSVLCSLYLMTLAFCHSLQPHALYAGCQLLAGCEQRTVLKKLKMVLVPGTKCPAPRP